MDKNQTPVISIDNKEEEKKEVGEEIKEEGYFSEFLKYSGATSRLLINLTTLRFASYAPDVLQVFKKLPNMRGLSYASDVGEGFRGVAPNYFVKGMYGLTGAYICGDLYFKYHENRHLKNLPKEEYGLTPIQKFMGYHTLWHAQASLVFPSVTIHTIVNLVKNNSHKLKMIKNPKILAVLPAMVAIGSIPAMIKPLDYLADKIMEYTYCKVFKFKPTHIH